jgi:hypothetical protein
MKTTVATYQLAYLSGQVSLCDDCVERADHECGALGPVLHGDHRGECQGRKHTRHLAEPLGLSIGRPVRLSESGWRDSDEDGPRRHMASRVGVIVSYSIGYPCARVRWSANTEATVPVPASETIEQLSQLEIAG